MPVECEDCNHKYLVQGQSGEAIVPATGCPSCGSPRYRSQVGPTKSDMDMRDLPEPGIRDMGGNPLQEGILAKPDGGWKNRRVRDESFAKVADGMDFSLGFGEVEPTMTTKQPQHKVLITPNAEVYSAPEPTTHEQIASTLGDPQQHLTHSSLGVVYDDGTSEFLQHPSGLDNEQVEEALRCHFGQAVHVPPLQQKTESQRWFGEDWDQGAKGDTPHPSWEVNDPDFTRKKFEEQQAVKQRGRPFNYYENPFFNRGGSVENWEEQRQAMHLPLFYEAADVEMPMETTEVAPPGPHTVEAVPSQHGLHNEVLHALSNLGVQVGGRALDPEYKQELLTTKSPFAPNDDWRGQSIMIAHEDPDIANVAKSVVEEGNAAPYRDWHHDTHNAYRAQVQPSEFNKDVIQGLGYLDTYLDNQRVRDYYHKYMPMEGRESLVEYQGGPVTVGAKTPEHLQIAQRVLQSGSSEPARQFAQRSAAAMIAPAAGGFLTRMIPGLMGGALSQGAGDLGMLQSLPGVGPMMPGGGASQPPAGPPPITPPPTFEALSAYGDDYEHPSSVPSIGTKGGPEDVDPHEFDADSSILPNLYDPTTNDIGGTQEGKEEWFEPNSDGVQRFQMLLPLILHYYQSEDPGANDPILKSLHDLLENEHPGYLMKSAAAPPQPYVSPFAPQPTAQPQTPIPQAPTPGQKRICPFCGDGIEHPEDMTCERCRNNVKEYQLQQPVAHTAGMPMPMPPGGPPMGGPPMPPSGGNETQGPRNSEQQAAVAQLLMDTGRQDEIPLMLTEPWNYAEELAEIQQREPPPEPIDQTALPDEQRDPAMEEAPPEATTPVPGMAVSRMQAALNRFTSEPRSTPRLGSVHLAERHDHEDLHVPIGVPAADQEEPEDLRQEQDSSLTWKDEGGAPLTVGQEYEVFSDKYDIPDLVRIEAVKPDSIEWTTIGEYGLEHRTEITHEEALMDGLTFHPSNAVEDGPTEEELPDPGIEQNNAGTDELGTRDLSTPHVHLTHEAKEEPELVGPDWLRNELPKTAGKKYTPSEQRDFIDEDGEARNLDKLNLSNTHYEDSVSDDAMLWW